MQISVIFDRCTARIEQLLNQRQLYIRDLYRCNAHHYFTANRKIQSGIVVSSTEGEAGLITRAWGVVFIDPTKVKCCTDIHNSFYGEGAALRKLLRELEKMC